jgi:SnoaL-like domain
VTDGLVTSDVPLPDDVQTFLTETARLYAARDDDHLLDTWFTDDLVVSDHRPFAGGDAVGREAFRHYLRTTRELLPDFRISIHVLAVDGSIYLARDTYDGSTSAVGGGETVMQWWVVDRLSGGRLAREDVYETEDQARAAFAEATGG